MPETSGRHALCIQWDYIKSEKAEVAEGSAGVAVAQAECSQSAENQKYVRGNELNNVIVDQNRTLKSCRDVLNGI